MLRTSLRLITLAFFGLTLSVVLAQNAIQLELGDPPLASLISISPPDDDGLVTISGAAGAVFPGAQVAIRNLYTEDTVYTQAGITGSFSTTIAGAGNTPFWISPAPRIPTEVRDRPGSLPGGPGTIIYGPFPQSPLQTRPVTQLVVDGEASDWESYYPGTTLASGAETLYTLHNSESLYVALGNDLFPAEYQQLELRFVLSGATYSIALDPRLQQTATLTQITPAERPLGTLAVASAQGSVTELRIPLSFINVTLLTATLEQVRFLDAEGNEISAYPVSQPLLYVEEVNGIVRLDSRLGDDFTRFTIAGPLAQGAGRWMARGRIQSLNLNPGDELYLEMDVMMDAPGLPESLVGLQLMGQLSLQPVIGADGMQAAGGLHSNNGWSNLLTPSGLAISNLRANVPLGEASVPAPQVLRRDGRLVFGMTFTLTLPDDLPQGLYVPAFQGFGQVGDGDRFSWESNGLLGTGSGISRLPLTRLPIVLNVGAMTGGRLLWTLFQDVPSDGSRGLMADEDSGQAALDNRVRFNSLTYILPPAVYSIEPYLLNQMPNAYDSTAAPLIPFLFPGGRLTAQVTRPDGTVDDLGSISIVQNRLSSVAEDERTRFGAQSQVDVYGLTTFNALLTDYPFDAYGNYEIALSGSVDDLWGNRYDGGGTYRVLIAELLDMTPGVLPGTPFEVGDLFNAGLLVAPGVPADVTITVQVYPLDGGEPLTETFEGKANRYGYFHTSGLRFETPGEYVIDYEARYTDTEGRLWAGSLRSAGVIANPESTLIAHGERGLYGYYPDLRPAQFVAQLYAPDTPAVGVHPNYPYHQGDVAWLEDRHDTGMRPVIQVQDIGGAYANWLLNTVPDYRAADGRNMARLALEDALPVTVLTNPDTSYSPALDPDIIVNDTYAYVSAVRPDVTVRQFVQGAYDDALPVFWDEDDPLNQQIGAGARGDLPGDIIFLFGGAVVRNDSAGLRDTAIYASLALVVDEDDPYGTRVYPPFQGEPGSGNTGPLLTLSAEPVEMFFHPTGTRPGQILTRGDTLAIAGQVAPTLASIVSVTITAPDGAIRQFEGTANAIGYFYDPANDFEVDQLGVWTVEIAVRHEGNTSVGPIEPPPPTGGVLGAAGGSFPVYVLPEDAEPLAWTQRNDFTIPAALPHNFSMTIPEDWTVASVYHTVTTPSYILSDGLLPIAGRAFSLQYHPVSLSRVFPNLESDRTGVGAASSDVATVTFVVTGLDADGNFQIRGRTFTIMHDRMITQP